MIGRLVGLVIIAFSLVIQVFALTALFDAFELFDTAWRDPFYTAGKLYFLAITVIGNALTGLVTQAIAATPLADTAIANFALPCWWVHALAMYIGASIGIWGGSIAFGNKKLRVNELARGGLAIAWPVAIATIVIQGIRNRPIATFTRENNGIALLYGLTALGMYAGANWANVNVLTGPPGPNQEVSIKNEVPCPTVNLKRDLPDSMQGFFGGA